MGTDVPSDSDSSRRGFFRHASSVSMSSLLRAHTVAVQDLPTDITSMTASQLSKAIRAREVSCSEVMRAYLGRIYRYNPVYNAIVSMVEDNELIRQAELADRALDRGEYWGWMHGMPHAVKDLADVQGLESSHGSRIYAGTIATEDSLHVARIRAHGAIFIGKTNTPEFGWGSQTYNDVHGTTRNAYDSELTAGGSSGGAAAGMATHMLPVADGSDMMGSLRNPAAFNNVIGFRPSQGRIPRLSDNLYYSQLSTDGPMGRSVEDEIPPPTEFRPPGLDGVRIGWMGDYDGYLATEPGLLELGRRSLDHLAAQGASVENCMPAYDMSRLWEAWLTLRHWSACADRPLYDDPETRKLLKPEVVWEIEGSIDMPASRISDAAVARSDWYRALHALFERYDLLALPSAQVFPFPADIHWPQSINGRSMDTYHRWMEVTIGGTLAGLPVVNLPAGFDDEGRPMGIQFLGPVARDREVLEFALAYEAATDYLDRWPALKETL
jgi:amidase